MRAFGSLTLAVLFVFLGAFNVWIMLANRASSGPTAHLWIRRHRVAGYLFILVLVISIYFMMLRLKGDPDEPSPRTVVHMVLGLLLVPLLVLKVLVARFQKAARGLLAALGIAIFAAAFTLVAMNVAVHLLRSASPAKVPASYSAVFVLMPTAVFAFWFFRSRVSSKSPASAFHDSVEPATPKGLPAIRLSLARVVTQTQDAKTLRFLVPRDQRLSARPGQFLTFEWVIDGQPVWRSYSICSSPTQTGHVEITAKRVANGRVSTFLNDHAVPGLVIKARGPYGEFCFDESKHERIVLLAGGSGITPIMAILRYMDDLCIRREATLIYCVRNEADVFFAAELADLQARLNKFRYVVVLSQPGPDWRGPRGRLSRELLASEISKPDGATFFLCGPPGFMDHTHSLLTTLGVASENILQEHFGATSTMAPQPPDHAAPAARVEFVRARVVCDLSPTRTVLEASERNRVPIPYSCRQGVCGTCAVKLLSGSVQMEREEGLPQQLKAQGYILPCVSRPLSDVRVDA